MFFKTKIEVNLTWIIVTLMFLSTDFMFFMMALNETFRNVKRWGS